MDSRECQIVGIGHERVSYLVVKSMLEVEWQTRVRCFLNIEMIRLMVRIQALYVNNKT